MPAEGTKTNGATPPASAVPPASSAAGIGKAPAPAVPSTVTYYYLSQLLRCRVRFEGEQEAFGRVHDVGAGFTTPYPLVACLDVRSRRHGTVMVPWSAVAAITAREIVVRKDMGPPSPVSFWLKRGVLDGQVVDLSGVKVVRVNDIHFLMAEGRLILAHVEVGFLGILRRLRFERAVSGFLGWLLGYTIDDKFVSWRHVQVILRGGPQGELHVSTAPSRLAEIHPAELAEIMEELGVNERNTFFSALPIEQAADALEEVDPQLQRTLISGTEPGKAADILEEMPAQEAADVLRDLHTQDALRIISRMETDAAKDIRLILAHEEETAGAIMSTTYVTARPNERADLVLERLRAVADQVEIFNYIYVLDDARHLLGVLSLRELLRAAPDAAVDRLMTARVVNVALDASVKDVARLFLKFGLRAIPVVDGENVFQGAVRLKSILGELAALPKE